MFGRGWLCIIERGRLFDIHGLYGGCVGLCHYYNGNLRATYTRIYIYYDYNINILYIYIIYTYVMYSVTHFSLFPVDFRVQAFRLVQVNSRFSQFNVFVTIISKNLYFINFFVRLRCLFFPGVFRPT